LKQQLPLAFGEDDFVTNIQAACSSVYFGGFMNPKALAHDIEKIMTTYPQFYPEGCVIYVIWSKGPEQPYFYYLFESPIWVSAESKWVSARSVHVSPSQRPPQNKQFPFHIRKMELKGTRLYLVQSSNPAKKLEAIPSSDSISIQDIALRWNLRKHFDIQHHVLSLSTSTTM